jgi:hypothetical protein
MTDRQRERETERETGDKEGSMYTEYIHIYSILLPKREEMFLA